MKTAGRLFPLAMLVAWLCIAPLLTFAQTDPFLATATRIINVRSGPGTTFLQIGTVPDGATVRIAQRNRIGTWLYIQYPRADGSIALEGWAFAGSLRLDPALRLSEVWENSDVQDADPSAYPALSHLLAAPVIPRLDGALLDNVRAIFARGQAAGMLPNAFAKIGDSLSADPLYLTPMSAPPIQLGAYDYLAETIDYYADSAAVQSIAAQVGMGTYTVLDPQWANPSTCAGGESPLLCAFRVQHSSIALIQFGSNDIERVSTDYFASEYRQIAQATIDAGVIPVLFTFSWDENSPLWSKAVEFNNAIVDIGTELNIPVINLWLAARPLPAFGLDVDGIHMLHSGFPNIKFTDGDESYFGATLRNLLAIRTLHEIRRMLDLPASLTATPEVTPAG
ncbi:MAG: SH3 domain-containing protein [Anaerolineae bacterium]